MEIVSVVDPNARNGSIRVWFLHLYCCSTDKNIIYESRCCLATYCV